MNTNFDALLQYHSNFILSLSVICKDIFLENMTATDISLANAKYITWYRFELKLKNTLERIQYRSLPSCNSIKTFDFSTLYTLFPHSKLKDRLWSELCFIKKNDQRRYKYLALGWDKSYFAKKKKKLKKKLLWFYQKVLWNWYQHARVFDWQHILLCLKNVLTKI